MFSWILLFTAYKLLWPHYSDGNWWRWDPPLPPLSVTGKKRGEGFYACADLNAQLNWSGATKTLTGSHHMDGYLAFSATAVIR